MLFKRQLKQSVDCWREGIQFGNKVSERYLENTYVQNRTEAGKLLFLLWDVAEDMPDRFRKYLAPKDMVAPFFLSELSSVIRSSSLVPPKNPDEIHDVVEQALRSIVLGYLNHELVIDNLRTFPGRHNLAECVRFIRIFRFTGIQEECCQLMILLDHGGFKNSESEQQQWHITTHTELVLCLSSLPPDEVPSLWKYLRDPEKSSVFWPVLTKSNARESVPYLLELMPEIPLDGQNAIIGALQRIGDVRAVPILQAIASDQANFLYVSASRALAHILKNSKDDSAQLLRASDAENAPGAKETLLRASGPTVANSSDSSELLRHSASQSE